MKSLVVLSFVLWLTSCSTQTVTPEEAHGYVGTRVIVCGEVASTYTSKKGNVFLNFGGEYPNQVFSIVIYSEDAATFENNPATLYQGKKICVTGTVHNYKKKPQIQVSDQDQLEIK